MKGRGIEKVNIIDVIARELNKWLKTR